MLAAVPSQIVIRPGYPASWSRRADSCSHRQPYGDTAPVSARISTHRPWQLSTWLLPCDRARYGRTIEFCLYTRSGVLAWRRDWHRVGGKHYTYTHTAAIAKLLGDTLVPLHCSSR